jgi:hypothetical protein
MARNQPFDFSDDDDIGITSRSASDSRISSSRSSDLPGASGDAAMAGMSDDDLLDDAAAPQADRTGSKGARDVQKSAQQTQTATRSSSGQQDTPTSIKRKRGNQPR